MSDRTSPVDPEFQEALGRSIRLLRIDRKLDRRDLAERAGISYSYLSAIENGQKAPSGRLLYALARELGLRDDELLAAARERLAVEASGLSGPPSRQTALFARSSLRRPDAPDDAGPASVTASAAALPPQAAAPAPAAIRPKVEGGEGRARERRRAEMSALIDQLAPEDAEAVIDLARRLAGPRG